MPVNPSSFRDNNGFIFHHNGTIFRQVNLSYKENYDLLLRSGLYAELLKKGLIIAQTEDAFPPYDPEKSYKIVRPDPVPFISYPYEWSFSQLKAAALATLEIQKISLSFGMSLKDSSAYNIQFVKGKPVLIDTLSFEKYKEGEPWVAYRQFCQHFLAPLALMSFSDVRLNKLLSSFIDGIPLDLAANILPFRAKARFTILVNIVLHSLSQKRFAAEAMPAGKNKVSRNAFAALIDNLESSVRAIKWKPLESEWGNYYENTNYSAGALEEKKSIVKEFLKKFSPKSVWDMGANDGMFSRVAAELGINTVSFDSDYSAVEKNYLKTLKNNENGILPLILDLTSPSPGIGWQNEERISLIERGPCDAALALALLHHLAISNNLPFDKIADFFSKICRYLIIEFVPKTDSQVRRLLQSREDIFGEYNQASFEKSFGLFFQIMSQKPIPGSERTLYLMKKDTIRGNI